VWVTPAGLSTTLNPIACDPIRIVAVGTDGAIRHLGAVPEMSEALDACAADGGDETQGRI